MSEKPQTEKPGHEIETNSPQVDDDFSARLSREVNGFPGANQLERHAPSIDNGQTLAEDKPTDGRIIIRPIATELPLPAGQKPVGEKRAPNDKSLTDSKGSKRIDQQLLLPDIYLEIDSAVDQALKAPNSKIEIGKPSGVDAGSSKGTQHPERAGAAKKYDTFVGIKIADIPPLKIDVVGEKVKPKVSEGDGTVLVNGVSADSTAAERHVKTTVTKDGTFTRDVKNRVISSQSPDGKVKRTFVYGDEKEPNTVTEMTENGKTYKNIGAMKFSNTGESVKKDGLVMSSWSIYGDNKQISEGMWYGNRNISPDGVYTELDDRKGTSKFQDGSGKELTKEQADSRNKDGIWPSKINISRPDGTTIEANLVGNVVETLKEKSTDDGKEKSVTWTKSGEQWVSDENPSRKRTALTLKTNGDLSYTDRDGTQKVESKNSELFATKNGIKDSYDRYGDRIKVETADGVRDLKYSRDAKGLSTLSEITTKTGDTTSVWTRKGNSDQWTSGEKSEVRKNLTVVADGSLKFDDKDGKQVKETTALERINYNSKNLPEFVSFPSGATRRFSYDDQGLSKFVDHIPTKDGAKHDLTWERDKDGSFVSKRENGKVFRREQVSVTDDADIKYLGTDKTPHEAKVRDIDRIARGEFVLSSESIVEARDRLVDAVKSSGIKPDRFNKWIKEFEENAVTDNVAPEKVVKAMNNLSDILLTKEKSPDFTGEQLESIVETGMHNITKYLEIDQGSHPTCNVTSVEVVAARKHPDEYTRLLKEVALKGHWITSEGKKATPPTGYKGTDPDGKQQVYNSIKPGKDEKNYDVGKPDSGERNIASQIVQMTLINAMYEHGHMNKVDDKGKVLDDRSASRYVMGPNRELVEITPGGKTITDLGEDLLMRDGKPVLGADGKPTKGGPDFVQEHVVQACQLLFAEKPAYIKASGFWDDNTGKRNYMNDLPDKQRMLDWKKDGKLPILTPTMGGAHAQTIHDVWEDKSSGKLWVLLDNQHGEPEVKGKGRNSGEGDGDGWITLDDLHATIKQSAQGAGFGKPVMPTVHKYSHPSKIGK
jgi:hypothetical protein